MKDETRGWLDQAKEHYNDALLLYEHGRYSMAVYCCHQALEMILKAAIVEKTSTSPPKIHKLDELAKQTTLVFSPEWYADLAEITGHFWRVRYPDFRQYVYTSKEKIAPTMDKTKEMYLWISKQFDQH
ncbi:HEPN domain-containing protein [Candidatus Gottesmanbacteria bacterium]|nr:HEPN domain-containing protein [Candidatus Gottesmanbacteria bacterium]